MSEIDTLILIGSPGAGKSTIADAISQKLLGAKVKHAVIDLDDLAGVYPESIDVLNALKWKNLAAVWPNYAAFGDLKVIIPVVIDNPADLALLKQATPSERFSICNLTASVETLNQRVTKRESNEYWQNRLRELVKKYHQTQTADSFSEFKINTDDKSVEDTTREVIKKLGWLA